MISNAAMELSTIVAARAPEREYSGFPWWHALLVSPNREQKSAEWLKRVRVFVYLPVFSKVICWRGNSSRRRLCAALPGMLFVPREMMDIHRRDEVFEFAEVHGYIRTSSGAPTAIGKADIELIRLLEARLNLPPEAKGVLLKVGQKVRFKDGSTWQGWGGGSIFDIVDHTRIGVEVAELFGRATPVYVPESEIEAM